MQGGDRGLQLILAGAAEPHRLFERPQPLRKLSAVPQGLVLIAERHVPARVAAGGPAGVVQQHEREQSPHLGLAGHQLAEQPPEANRLAAQLTSGQLVAGAGRIPLVEDEVHGAQYAAQPSGQLVIGRHLVPDARGGDLVLRAGDSLPHRRLGDEERVGDLGGGQAAEGAQRQRDLRRRVERRVAAGEDQPEPVIEDHGRLAGGGVFLLV